MRAPDWIMSTRGMVLVILSTALAIATVQQGDIKTLATVVTGIGMGYVMGRRNATPGEPS